MATGTSELAVKREARRRARAGAAWLDEKVPGWVEHVDASALRQSQCDLCVLGQLGEEIGGWRWYPAVAERLGLDPEGGEAISFGFSNEWGGDGPLAWTDLDDAWRHVIAERRS